MKPALFSIIIALFALTGEAQNVTTLPPGKYETRVKANQNKWDKGDLVIIDESHYKLGNNSEVGDYRFSVVAQRIFFTSGPLKSAYTKVLLNNNKTVIVFPTEQNSDLGLTAEVWASKQ